MLCWDELYVYYSEHDESETLPSQKRPKTIDSTNYTCSVPVIKEEIETPKKVTISLANTSFKESQMQPCKVALEEVVEQKAVALPDSPSPGPAAIPESPVSSPGEQKHQNDNDSSCESAPPSVKVEQSMVDSKVWMLGCRCGISCLFTSTG